ncbi:MAG: hypothetical protein J6F31_09425 [Oscillospiraceae bacterium]|nr:hypothetical protein [Oscillospiraceae bacterium]
MGDAMKKYYTIEFKKGSYNHFFGGKNWKTPVCKNCNANYHQILLIDLNDPLFSHLRNSNECTLPIVSCLNCSSCWDYQIFKVNHENEEIQCISDTDTEHWINTDDTIESPLLQKNIIFIPVTHFNNSILDDLYSKMFVTGLGTPPLIDTHVDLQCPLCKNMMDYVVTITSDWTHIIKEIDFVFGELFIYFFYCKKCGIMKTIGQGT